MNINTFSGIQYAVRLYSRSTKNLNLKTNKVCTIKLIKLNSEDKH